jgi:hypothetical protein
MVVMDGALAVTVSVSLSETERRIDRLRPLPAGSRRSRSRVIAVSSGTRRVSPWAATEK